MNKMFRQPQDLRPSPPAKGLNAGQADRSSAHQVRGLPVSLTQAAYLTLLSVCLGSVAGMTYLMFDQQGPATSLTQQTEVHRAYEDRIAMLRGEIDRIKSRQLLDQHTVEEKIDQLFDKQRQLKNVHQSVESVLSAARESGLRISTPQTSVPTTVVPRGRPQSASVNRQAMPSVTAVTKPLSSKTLSSSSAVVQSDHHLNSFAPSTGLLDGSKDDPFAAFGVGKQSQLAPADLSTEHVTNGEYAPNNFASLSGELDDLYSAKLRVLDTIVTAAEVEATTLRSVIDRLGVKVADMADGSLNAVGGPLVELSPFQEGDVSVRLVKADRVFKELGELRSVVRVLPIANPVKAGRVSSGYGRRLDPFLRRPAMHTGIDFKAPRGTRVEAAGSGRVVFAGRKGGYGKMVEVDHGYGLVTRYAHLHRYSVSEGDHVEQGEKIGEVGSTGRSTGPHLHFETRRFDKPTNPKAFLKAGTDLKSYL